MSLTLKQNYLLAKELDKRIHGNHLNNFTAYCDDTFFFQISKGKRLYIVMDNKDPRVYLSNNDCKCKSFSSNFISFLKRDLNNAEIIKVSVLNDDKLLLFELTILNSVFKLEKRYLVAELIDGKANLLVLDKDKKILAVYRASNIEGRRLLIKGATYEPPIKRNNMPKEKGSDDFDFDSYCQVCMDKEPYLEKKRKNERFKGLIHYLSSKQKSSQRKIERIENDIEKAKERINDNLLGDYIYTNYEDIDLSKGYFEYGGKRISLDTQKSKSQNAETFYKSAKKAKKSMQMGDTYLKQAIKEKAFYDQLADIIDLSKEEDLEDLAVIYNLDAIRQKGRKAKSNLGEVSTLPFQVEIEGTYYVFGRNAEQNNFLSFLFDHSKNHMWMHLKDSRGAHLIIRKDNPSKMELQIGAELTCLASKKQECEVMVALKKDVHRGRKIGEAIVKEYETVVIRNISSLVKNAFETAARIKLR